MRTTLHRARCLALAMFGSLLLTGCLFTPGKFGSQLSLFKDGSFEYSYDGEIVFFLLTNFIEEMRDDTQPEFSPYCYDEETDEDRECSEEEIAAQRADWDAAQELRAANREREMEQAQRVLGFDPSDPEAGNRIAEKLQRQAGWQSVIYRGEGIFDVRYSIEGKLTHDFAFPTVEGMPNLAPFLVAYRRDGDRVRIDAPGFKSGSSDDPTGMGGGGLGLMTMGMIGSVPSERLPDFAMIDGTFALVTDGQILANNTDEGPERTSNGLQRLTWRIDPKTTQAPTALVEF